MPGTTTNGGANAQQNTPTGTSGAPVYQTYQSPVDPNTPGSATYNPNGFANVVPGSGVINNPNGLSGSPQNINPNPIITSSSLAPASPIQLPPAPTPTPAAGAATNGNATIAANTPAITPTATTSTSSDPNSLSALIASIGAPPPSSSSLYNADYAASGIDQKQINANNDTAAYNTAKAKLDATNAQIQGLNAESQAAYVPIGQQFDGRASVGFESAATTAAQRNIALQTLPLQAQALSNQAEVAAAQGQSTLSQSILTQAQAHLDKVFQIQSTDAINQYNYETAARKAVYDYATAQEKAKLDAQQHAADQAFTTSQNNLNNAQAIAKSAMDAGQGQLAAQITALDPKSTTYTADLAKLQSQVVPKNDTSFQDIGGRKVQVVTDASGKIISKTDLGASTQPKATVADQKQSSLDTLTNIITSNNGGKPMPNGKMVIDSNGFITPEGLQTALAAAPSEGLTQADVINQLKPYISLNNDGTVMSTYKLNAALAKLVSVAP